MADDRFEFVTRIFENTEAMAKELGCSKGYCQSIMTKKVNHKNRRYERVWFENEEKLDDDM